MITWGSVANFSPRVFNVTAPLGGRGRDYPRVGNAWGGCVPVPPLVDSGERWTGLSYSDGGQYAPTHEVGAKHISAESFAALMTKADLVGREAWGDRWVPYPEP